MKSARCHLDPVPACAHSFQISYFCTLHHSHHWTLTRMPVVCLRSGDDTSLMFVSLLCLFVFRGQCAQEHLPPVRRGCTLGLSLRVLLTYSVYFCIAMHAFYLFYFCLQLQNTYSICFLFFVQPHICVLSVAQKNTFFLGTPKSHKIDNYPIIIR